MIDTNDMTPRIGIDIGGTNTKIVVLRRDEGPVTSLSPSGADPAASVRDLLTRFLWKHGLSAGRRQRPHPL